MRKRSVSIEFVTVLARLLTRHGNRVGAHLLRRRRGHGDPGAAAGGATCCTSCTGMLDAAGADAAPAAPTCADFLQRRRSAMIPRRSLVFVVSDFISAPGWDEPLALLAQRHEVLAVRLYDPLEMELPDLGMVVVQDAETGEQLFVDTHDRRLPQALRARWPSSASRRCAPRSARRAWTRSSCPPTTTWSTRSCASPTCASAAASSRRAASLPQHLTSPAACRDAAKRH